jgi:hypothetical protein
MLPKDGGVKTVSLQPVAANYPFSPMRSMSGGAIRRFSTLLGLDALLRRDSAGLPAAWPGLRGVERSDRHALEA